MAYLSDFDISGYGLSAQRFRMNVISSNIAIANTTRTAEGGPYRRKEVVFKAIEFDKELNKQLNAKNDFLENENPLDDPDAPRFPKPAISTVVVDKIVRDDKDFKMAEYLVDKVVYNNNDDCLREVVEKIMRYMEK